MTPPVFFVVAALGLTAPLMAQTPVHSMPREASAPFTCLPILEGIEDADSVRIPCVERHRCGLEADEAIRADRNVLVFSDLNPLAPGEHFCPVRTEAIEGLEVVAPDLQETPDPVPEDRPSPLPGGVVTVGRITRVLPAATPVPEPGSALLVAIAALGLIRRRRS